MTMFVKDNFVNSGGYITYNGKFVARFKHARDGVSSFITCLVKNFTVEEYFELLDSGKAPLTIAESKGYLLPHIKSWLKRDGYPVNTAGYKQFIEDRIGRRLKNVA